MASTLTTGLIRPFRRGARDFESSTGDPNVLAKVGQVLGTVKGTLPWEPSFGSDLNRLRHKGNTPILKETVRVYVDDALRRWVPKALLVQVTPIEQATPNSVELRVVVQIGNKQQALTQRL